ncbi:hypothetical protein HY380_01420 [Candidatus Saccharibacteria bacterium]|nr:hypothetical protein [Candidatus Saccharibacteria bacterium]
MLAIRHILAGNTKKIVRFMPGCRFSFRKVPDNRFRRRINYLPRSVYLLVVGILFLSVYQQVRALSDLTDSWNFSDPGQYSFSGGIETSGSTARLKAQNYASDANTAALFHFDESVGSTAADSSANGNDATGTNTSFVAGNLNNAVSLNGTNASLSAPDSSSLSLSQANTIEAWTKLNDNLSAGTIEQRQGIADKGDYSLYYDNETGKLTYELADQSATNWSVVAGNETNGGWDTNGKRQAYATAKIGSNIYVSLADSVSDAEVWQWDGSSWTQIGGGQTGVNNSWVTGTYEGVYALTTDGSNLYAGLGAGIGDAEAWKYNGSSWTKIGGDGLNSSWTAGVYEQVMALDYYGGNLYAGLGNSANDAEVWRWNGSVWTKIGGDSLNSGWTTNFEDVRSLTNDGTNLYAGLGASAGEAEVWKYNGTSWTKIGGDTVNTSWDATNYDRVWTMKYFGSTLYAGIGDSTGEAEVWAWNGSTWTKIGGDAVNSSWADATYERVGSLAYDGSNVYAGLSTGEGDGEVWKYNGSVWSQVGGDGLNSSWSTASGDSIYALIYDTDSNLLYAGTTDTSTTTGPAYMFSFNGTSWTRMGGEYINNSWGNTNASTVVSMAQVGTYMYAGIGLSAGTANVWRWDGTSWTRIGGQGLNSSWTAQTYEQVMSMTGYNNNLYVGLGISANDAEVWKWDGSTWSQVGGDSLNSGWTTNYEEVYSLAAYGGYLYAGLGASASDAEVWRYDGSVWSKIGGDSINSGWTTNYDRVRSFTVFSGQLVAGLGDSAGEAEVWAWNGTAWTKIGGDAVNSSWSTTYEAVHSLAVYNGELYAGLGSDAGDAEIWKYNGSSWTKVGGDAVSNSWEDNTYFWVRSLAVYNGDLYAAPGSATNVAGLGEVWKYDGTSWTKIGGDLLNGSWSSGIEDVYSLLVYKGKLHAGLGVSTTDDDYVYSLGNNRILQSAATSWDTSWHHVAATYNGATMRLYIDGVLNAQSSTVVSLPDSSRALLIGSTYGGQGAGEPQGWLAGNLDELRLSDSARASFTTTPYSSADQTITLANPARTSGVWHWDSFSDDDTANGGTVTYRLSTDGGDSWLYWDTGWVESSSTTEANDIATISANIDSLPITFDGLTWQAILKGNGNQRVTLNSVGATATSDTIAPATNASAIAAKKALAGSDLAQNDWTNGASPYFSWTAGDDQQIGLLGYCLYLGTDNTADPVSTKGLLGSSPVDSGGNCQFAVSDLSADMATPGYISAALSSSNSPYYLSVKAIDQAGNVSDSAAQFYFRFDNTAPANPGFISAPSSFINIKTADLTWPTVGASAASDANSGVIGLQYKIGDTVWYGDSHSGAGDITDLLTNDGGYTTVTSPDFDNLAEGVNTIYFRTWDQAGNVSTSYATAALKINTTGSPSEPQNVEASPATSSSNSFAFSWDPPDSYVGDEADLTYCYTINTLPTADTCTFTAAGVTNLGAGPYATQPGLNTFYVAARDESGNISYNSYSSVGFTANTSAPGLPLNVEVVDVSLKASSNWRLALTWNTPTDEGSGVESYKIYRSTNNISFSQVGSSSSLTYVDAGLSQTTYYYKVKACDNTNNCGALSSAVSLLPTGRYYSAASLVSDPEVSDITTRKAKVSWSTDRASDSRIAIGTGSGNYNASEIANSDQATAHEINLSNLSAGTNYYYVAKWTDEDGNTGTSPEFTFKTAPAPSLKEISVIKRELSSAIIQFTSRNATKVAIYYGKSESFGGIKSINTSKSESTYEVELSGLDDGSQYLYKLVSFDEEGSNYDGSTESFTTPLRPQIFNLRFQPVKGAPTSTQKVSWETNVAATSLVSYGKLGGDTADIQKSNLVTDHEIIISGLEDNSRYRLLAQSRDKSGNLAVSDEQVFKTALDTRPPKISNLTVEPSIKGVGAEARGQIVVSWQTDEPATSQVAFAEGLNAKTFNNRTVEDTQHSTEHIVIISDLSTSKIYSLQPLSRDDSGNLGSGNTDSAIIGRASDSVLTIILDTLRKILGF